MKLFKILFTSLIIIGLAGGNIFALDSEILGRDVVEGGSKITISGYLAVDGDHEWLLQTDNGIFTIHFGPPEFRDSTGIPLEKGKQAVIQGFLLGSDLTPITISIDSEEYSFRDPNGFPLWAGNGRGSNSPGRYGNQNCDGCTNL